MTFASSFGRTFSPTFQPKSVAAASVSETTVTFDSVADTSLSSFGVTYNYGTSSPIYISLSNSRTVLMRFNLSSILASATCISAKLTLTFNNAIAAGNSINIYEIASANGDWVEGTKNGAAQTGAPCWNYKAYDSSTPTAWAGSAGCNTAGTDYINTVVASLTAGSEIATRTPTDILFNASGIAMIESWFGQSANSGIVLWSTATQYLYARENATYKPILTVTYS